jgi:hypothetical protein
MNGRQLYKQLKQGEKSSLTFQGSTDDHAAWARFAEKVGELDAMEAEGLIKITNRHREAQSGRSYIDMVLFMRMD